VTKVRDLASYLRELEDPTDNELELLAAIQGPFAKLAEELERREQERRRRLVSVSFGVLRRGSRGMTLRTWRPESTPSRYLPPSLA
jgi:hypothetical protein